MILLLLSSVDNYLPEPYIYGQIEDAKQVYLFDLYSTVNMVVDLQHIRITINDESSHNIYS